MMNPMAGHYLNNKNQEIGQKLTDWLEGEVHELREDPFGLYY